MKIPLRQRSIAWALAAWFALPGCAAQDPYRVADDELKVRWCPESGETTVYFDFGEPRPERYHPSPISTRPPILVHREGQPVQGSFRDSISIVNPISEGVDNRRQF